MKEYGDEVRCISCFRTYEDLNQWMYMTTEARIQRVKQLKQERVMTHNGVTNGSKKKTIPNRKN